MIRPILPIHKMSEKDFDVFKKQYLDGRSLDDKVIQQIKEIFALGSNEVVSISCDEAHAHGYKCLIYKSSEAGVVERLIIEIEGYRDLFKNIKSKIP